MQARAPTQPRGRRRRTARDEVAALHRRLFHRQRGLIRRSVQDDTPEFRAYEARYRRGVQRYDAVVPYEEVVDAVVGAGVAYVGDYHTLKQAQRAFLKLLQAALERDRDVVVCVEFVQGRYQAELDRWLAGGLDDETFLRRVDYRRHQVFDVWPHFEPVFDLCREQAVPMVAIDLVAAGASALPRRDAFAAERIARAVQDYPGALVLVLVGQLHIAPEHLPAAVDEALARAGHAAPPRLVAHQNCEEIYFALEDEGLEQTVQAVRLREREYCLVNTSPVVAQQSYLDWVEGDGDVFEGAGPEQNFKSMARIVAGFLGIGGAGLRPATGGARKRGASEERKELAQALEEAQVYTAGDLSFLKRLAERGDFSPREIAVLEKQIVARESYYLPRAGIAYLATLSVNHAAEEAAHFVRHVVSGDDDEPRGLIDSFYARALNEAFAFFGSKLVNPRRKCAHERELARVVARRDADPLLRRAAELVLAHKALERGDPGRRAEAQLRHSNVREAIGAGAELFNAVTHALGYILGEQLYYAMIRGTISKREVRDHFCDPLDEDGAAFGLYFYLVGRVGRTRIPKRA